MQQVFRPLTLNRIGAALFGCALLLIALSGVNVGGGTVGGDILAGWTRTWEWHATPDGKIWRGDGNGPFLDSYAEWGWQRRLEGNREQQVHVSPGAWKKAGFNCVFYAAATQSLAIRPRVATLSETAVTAGALVERHHLDRDPGYQPDIGLR